MFWLKSCIALLGMKPAVVTVVQKDINCYPISTLCKHENKKQIATKLKQQN